MASAVLSVNGVNASTGTWTNLTTAAVSTSDNTRATTTVAGNTATFALTSPTDVGAATAVVLNIEFNAGSGSVRPKGFLIELLDSVGTVLTSFTTAQTTSATDVTQTSASLAVTGNQAAVDGWQVRITCQEGGGMPGTPSWQVDRVWVNLTYDLASVNKSGGSAATVTASVVSGGRKGSSSGTVESVSASTVGAGRKDIEAGSLSAIATSTSGGGTASGGGGSSGYALATITNPSAALTDFTLLVDLSTLPQSWWDAIDTPEFDTTDPTKGRAFKGDGVTELACDWIEFDDVAQTGWVRIKWTGTLATSGTQQVQIHPPKVANASYLATDTYGQYNAYDSNWRGYWPDGGGNDRTDYQLNLTANLTSSATGKLGDATSYRTSGDAYEQRNYESALNLSSQITIISWHKAPISVDGGNGQPPIISRRDTSTNLTNYEWRVQRGASNSHLSFIYRNAANTGWARYEDTFVSWVGETWTHAAIGLTFGTASSASTYLNGSKTGGEWNLGTGAETPHTGTEPLRLGKQLGSGTGHFIGDLDDVQLHSIQRSDAWIAEEYAQTNSQATFWGTWTYETSEVDPSGGSLETVTVSTSGAGNKSVSDGSSSTVTTSVTGSGEKNISEGSSTSVTVSTTQGGTKSVSGGSSESVSTSTSGSGEKAINSGTIETVTTSTTGSGSKAISGGSQSTITVSAAGSGTASTSASGGSVASVTTSTTGGGRKAITSSSIETVAVSDVGSGVKTSSSGSLTSVVTSDVGAGSKASSSGSVSSVTATTTSDGSKSGDGAASTTIVVSTIGVGEKNSDGGQAATVSVTTTQDGTKGSSGGFGTSVTVATSGAGVVSMTGAGGSVATVTITTTGLGSPNFNSGSSTGVSTTTTGEGSKSVSEGSQTTVVVSTQGGGIATSSASGGSSAAVTTSVTGTGTKQIQGSSSVAVSTVTSGSGTKGAEGGSAVAVAIVTLSGGMVGTPEKPEYNETTLVIKRIDSSKIKTKSLSSILQIVDASLTVNPEDISSDLVIKKIKS